jgi:hypothetical protein
VDSCPATIEGMSANVTAILLHIDPVPFAEVGQSKPSLTNLPGWGRGSP